MWTTIPNVLVHPSDSSANVTRRRASAVCSKAVPPDNRVGEVLASKYRLEELLGSGGMGHVYRAVNEHVGRTVAIKVLRLEHAQNGPIVERFLREARAANLVRHPNVVDVLDVGKEDGGAPFIVQELLLGEDLAHLVARRGGKLPVEEVCDLLLPVIDAVAHAHAQGVVHRDIKPENVFLANATRGPIPKLLDFGISKVRAPDLRATEVGMMMGTPAYMAPEQVQGAREADPRSDVWALGVMMFELIAGRMPHDVMDAPALFVAIATKDAPTLLDVRAPVPPAISRVVERCLRRRPDERYPSAAELGRDLRHVLDGTELEPTGKRSLPPRAALRGVPDLALPGPPRSPSIPDAGAVDARAKTEVGVGPSPSGGAAPATPELPTPEAPSLPPPPLPAPAPAPAAERAPRPSPQLSDGPLSGVGLSPGSVSSLRTRASYPRRSDQPSRDMATTTDFSPLIGFAVVGLVTILGTGLLMQLVHRPEGWPVALFVFAPPPGIALAFHGAFALLAVITGFVLARRGVLHWRGDLSGGPPSAIVNAVMASGAFFCAIELASAVL